MAISAFLELLIPYFLGKHVDQYGYFRTYLLYLGFIFILEFGWSEGIYLRLGGTDYRKLDYPLYARQFWALMSLQLFFAFCVVLGGKLIFRRNPSVLFICYAVSISLVVRISRDMLRHILVATNRIKETAYVDMIGYIVYAAGIGIVMLLGKQDFRYLIGAELLGCLAGFGLVCYYCADILKAKPCKLSDAKQDIILNISAGSKLLIASFATTLIIDVTKLAVQQHWDVTTYGKISFTLSVCNLVVSFINAVALVLFPMLRNIDADKMRGLYGRLRTMLLVPLLGCLILYYPVQQVFSALLPQYAEGLKYMALLFPVCIFSAKMNMLTSTYMKVQRMEKEMLQINLIGLVFAAITTVISVFVFDSLTLTMLCIVINQAFRSVVSERVLAKRIQIVVKKDIVLELLMAGAFICVNWFVGGWWSVALYILCYIGYLGIEHNHIRRVISWLARIA